MAIVSFCAIYRVTLTVIAFCVCMGVLSCSDSRGREKLLLGKWNNADKGYVRWIEFSEDGTLRTDGMAGLAVGTWKVTDRGLLQLSPYALESVLPEPKREVEFQVTKDELKIKGGGIAGGPEFLRAK